MYILCYILISSLFKIINFSKFLRCLSLIILFTKSVNNLNFSKINLKIYEIYVEKYKKMRLLAFKAIESCFYSVPF